MTSNIHTPFVNFHIITIFPEMFAALQSGIVGRAEKNKLITINCINLRQYSDNRYGSIDDRPYGGGPGMVMLAEPLLAAIDGAKQVCHTAASCAGDHKGRPYNSIHSNSMSGASDHKGRHHNSAHGTCDQKGRPYNSARGTCGQNDCPSNSAYITDTHNASPCNHAHVMYLSPQGKPLTQKAIEDLAAKPNLIMIAGRYEGIDERVIESAVDSEWSIGDYVLSGGELAAMVVIDAITRLLPGALGDADSALQESFTSGILDYPHYTRPENLGNSSVPSVLLGGNHHEIARWRLKQALGRTWLRRPELLQKLKLTKDEVMLLNEFLNEANQQ